MNRRTMRVGLVTTLMLVGCGGEDGPSIKGMWEVATHTQNTSSCDAEGPAVADPLYIEWVTESIFGTSWLTYKECDDAMGMSCTGGGLFSLAYIDPIDDGYRAEVYSSSSSGGTSCALGYTDSTAVVQPDGSMRIETRRHTETITIASSDECTTDAAKARKATMPCGSFEVITATRVDGP